MTSKTKPFGFISNAGHEKLIKQTKNGLTPDLIYLDEVHTMRKKKSIKKFCLKHLVLILIVVSLLVVASHLVVDFYSDTKKQVQELKIAFIEQLTRTQVIKEFVKAEDVPTADLIMLIAKEFNIKQIILEVIIVMESKDDINQLYRFEPAQFAKRSWLDRKHTDAEKRMRSSSHGITHIMGYRAEECGLHWSELYDKRKALMCTALIMNKNLENARGKTKSERLYQAFKMYNGSDAYAIKAMSELGKILFNELI